LRLESLEPRHFLSAGSLLPAMPGLYDPVHSVFYLRDSQSAGAAEQSFGFGTPNAGLEPIAGDWKGAGTTTVGVYDPRTSTFSLRNSNTTGTADIAFGFGDPALSSSGQYVPVVGDWTGDGVDTVGLYDRQTACWYLRNSNTTGAADITFGFGVPGSNWVPVVGDWNGNGITTVGLYDPTNAVYYLRNSNSTGPATSAFGYGAPGSNWSPISGDWSGNGTSTIGFYDGDSSAWFLRNSNDTGVADASFGFGAAGAGWLPVVGDWPATVPPTGVTASLGLQDPALASLTQTLFSADGSINRSDMIRILQSVASDGVVSGTDLNDLKTILADAPTLNIPGYVQVLAGDVVNGSPANANYQGQPLGNLQAGDSGTQLNDLIGKWFYGADVPNAGTYSYQTIAGSLFVTSPAYTDMRQGSLSDCYLVSALGSLAESSPASIRNMFIDNGDGTWSVRFYTTAGKADYVTVNRLLPVNAGGYLVYDGMGLSAGNEANDLWLPLAEKAYAQWNETGNEGRDGTNTYSGLQNGWMQTVYAQVLGYSAGANFGFTASGQQTLISAATSGEAVTLATNSAPGNGLFASHAYVVTGYDSGSGTFTLYNPVGASVPSPLTYAQLQASCTCFAFADPSGSVAPSTVGTASSATPPGSAVTAVPASPLGSVPLSAGSPIDAAAADRLWASFGQNTESV
jgi:hypothetical protein